VVGQNNQLAHAAALAVAQAPAQAYNPLFLHGATGFGKTHLMHAIGHSILQRTTPRPSVAYLSTEKFTNEYHPRHPGEQPSRSSASATAAWMSCSSTTCSSSPARSASRKSSSTPSTTSSSPSGRSSSRATARVAEIAEARSRASCPASSGACPPTSQSPDFETRVAILKTKAATLKIDLPPAVIEFMAQHISKNIRRLEGALIKISSYAALTGKALDLASAEHLLKDVLMEEAQNRLNIEGIQKRVADHYQIRHSDMTSKRRPNAIAFPRQIAMYLSRQLTRHSLQEIGEAFGGRDHGTVIHAVKTVENMMEQDDSVRGSVDFLKTQLAK
jgi:chromosomal replication initiator protein